MEYHVGNPDSSEGAVLDRPTAALQPFLVLPPLSRVNAYPYPCWHACMHARARPLTDAVRHRQVESARADQRGVSFAIDFSGSTNVVLLPSPTATATDEVKNTANAKTKTTTATVTVTAGNNAVFADDGNGGRRGERGGGGAEEEEEAAGAAARQGEEAGAGARPVKGFGEDAPTTSDEEDITMYAAADGGASPSSASLSARVSAGAFCRAVVARVIMVDPEVGGTIKVRRVM